VEVIIEFVMEVEVLNADSINRLMIFYAL
jgi:hypothetical protein